MEAFMVKHTRASMTRTKEVDEHVKVEAEAGIKTKAERTALRGIVGENVIIQSKV